METEKSLKFFVSFMDKHGHKHRVDKPFSSLASAELFMVMCPYNCWVEMKYEEVSPCLN